MSGGEEVLCDLFALCYRSLLISPVIPLLYGCVQAAFSTHTCLVKELLFQSTLFIKQSLSASLLSAPHIIAPLHHSVFLPPLSSAPSFATLLLYIPKRPRNKHLLMISQSVCWHSSDRRRKILSSMRSCSDLLILMIHLEGNNALCFAPTILEGSVLHSEGAISFVGDVGVGVSARWVDNANLHVISRNLIEGAAVDDEVGCDISEDPWKQKKTPLCDFLSLF